ncbi:hypothetical protein [Flagellimonas onchidii]|uniref:hypothetical protein n=1 Tax=Flagellimonas onchidii TaxID=2562684 RepID=UPI0010A5BC36|nr:hypothetical protein [Allomuricauda onchidii]
MGKSKRAGTYYFHGIGVLIANHTGYSTKYVNDVLAGRHDGRDSKGVRKIMETAELFMTPVKDAETAKPA